MSELTILDPFQVLHIPLGDWVEASLNYLVQNFRGVFRAVRWPIDQVLNGIEGLLLAVPPTIGILLGSLLGGIFVARRGLQKTLFTLCCAVNIPNVTFLLMSIYQPDNLIVICAGVIMNTLLALAIFSGHHYSSGEDVRLTTTVGYVSLGSLSERQGVKAQDRVLAVDGVPVANWEEVERETLMKHVGRDQAITFERNGQRFTLNYATAKITSPDELVKAIGLDPVGYLPPVITDVAKGPDGPSPAMKAGLQAGDKIIRIQGDSILSGLALIDHVGANAGKTVMMEWMRGDSLKSATVTPDANGKIGVALQGDDYRGPKRHESYSLGRAIALGWSDVTTNASLTLKMLGMVLTGKTPSPTTLNVPGTSRKTASLNAAIASASCRNWRSGS